MWFWLLFAHRPLRSAAHSSGPCSAELWSLETGGTHPPTLAIDTDAKCPSALQVSGMMDDGKFSPELLLIPLSAYERTFATTSAVVTFNKSPLRRRRGVMPVSVSVSVISSQGLRVR